MRLLYLTAETWPTYRADVVVLFGKYLPRFGVQSDLVTGRTPNLEDSIGWDGGQAILCNITGGQAMKHIKMLWHGIYQLFTASSRYYDAIQVRDMAVLGAFGLLAARLKGIPFFYWASYPMSEGQITYAKARGFSQGVIKFLFPWLRGRVGRLLLYKFVLPWADHVFVQSERMLQDMVERGVLANNMTTIPMGVDFEAIELDQIAPADDPRLAGHPVLVYLGTLDPTRHIEVLFKMLALIMVEIPDILLLLVGDTEDDHHRAWLKHQAQIAGCMEHVIWTGWLPIHQGWRYVRAAEIGLSPFPRGFLLDSASPTKVLEYLALGVPVVCNDNPDQQAIIEASGAGLCVPYTAEDFSQATLELLRTTKEKRKIMAQAGRKFILQERTYRHRAELLAARYGNLTKAGLVQSNY